MHLALPRRGRSLIRHCRPTFETTLSRLSPRSIRVIAEFAEHFTGFEWTYLCSYPWFIAGLQYVVSRGSFRPLLLRAEQQLINESLRKPRTNVATDRDDPHGWLRT